MLNSGFLVTDRFVYVSVRQRPVLPTKLDADERSVYQRNEVRSPRLYVSSATSERKLLVENNCEIDNLEST